MKENRTVLLNQPHFISIHKDKQMEELQDLVVIEIIVV